MAAAYHAATQPRCQGAGASLLQRDSGRRAPPIQVKVNGPGMSPVFAFAKVASGDVTNLGEAPQLRHIPRQMRASSRASSPPEPAAGLAAAQPLYAAAERPCRG